MRDSISNRLIRIAGCYQVMSAVATAAVMFAASQMINSFSASVSSNAITLHVTTRAYQHVERHTFYRFRVQTSFDKCMLVSNIETWCGHQYVIIFREALHVVPSFGFLASTCLPDSKWRASDFRIK